MVNLNPLYYIKNNNATNELNTIKERLATLKKPTVKLSEKYMDNPEYYKEPYIEFKEGEIYFEQKDSYTKEYIKKKRSELKNNFDFISDISQDVYVKLPDDKTQPVEFVYVVFKGTYYMVLQVGIDKEESTLVIVSINNFDKKDELKQLENDMGVINSIRLYTPERIKYFNAGYENATINFIIKKVIEKYKNEYDYDLTKLTSNDVKDEDKIDSSEAYKKINTENYAFENVVKLCIYNRVLYMCIGINDSGTYPDYDLYLYNMNGTPYTIPGKRSNNLHFQYAGSDSNGFSALDGGTLSDVFAVNSMKFYTLPTINYIDLIIKKVIEKYKNEYDYDLTKLTSNDVKDDDKIDSSEAYKKIDSSEAYKKIRSQNIEFKDVVKLCIYNKVLYMCIGINDSGKTPDYDLYLYNMNGTPYTIPGKRSNNLHFQYAGSDSNGFSALDGGTRSDVDAVNSMKFYKLPTIETPTQANPNQEVTTGGKKHFMNTRRKSRRTRVGKSKKNRKVVKNRSRRIRM